MTKIIGLCGYAQVGKTTTAKAIMAKLGEQDSVIVSFAEPVKSIAYSFGWDGKKDERGRRLLQRIGTEVGREYNPNLWVNLWAEQVARFMGRGYVILVDDVRFQNEVDKIKELGGYVARVYSSVRGVQLNHTSENPDQLVVDFLVNADKDVNLVADDIVNIINNRINNE